MKRTLDQATAERLAIIRDIGFMVKTLSSERTCFSFNPVKSRQIHMKKKVVKIYGRVLSIDAQKVGPHANCDDECKAMNHRYTHDFTKKNVRMLGLSPGQVIKVPPGKWPLLIMD